MNCGECRYRVANACASPPAAMKRDAAARIDELINDR